MPAARTAKRRPPAAGNGAADDSVAREGPNGSANGSKRTKGSGVKLTKQASFDGGPRLLYASGVLEQPEDVASDQEEQYSVTGSSTKGRYLITSTPEDAVLNMRQHGYVFVRSAVPGDLCEQAARLIQNDVGARLDAGSPHQEEPIERLNKATTTAMVQIRDFVLDTVLPAFGFPGARTPEQWTETLYGRVKRRNFLTKWHCDAFNTVFERNLLHESNLDFDLNIDESKRFNRIKQTGEIDCSWNEVPIYTFWIALRDVTTVRASHLRLHPASHALKGAKLRREAYNVIPDGFKYSKHDFIGPERGYKQGDLVIFHCLTQHEANAHAASLKGKSRERVSMDGRFFLRLA